MYKRKLILIFGACVLVGLMTIANAYLTERYNRKVDFINACVNGDNVAVRAYLNAGGHSEDSVRGRTPLQAAILGGHMDTMRLLLDRGADPTDGLVWTGRGHGNSLTLLTMLIARGAKVSGDMGASALYASVGENDVAAVNLLLQHGADVNAEEEPGGNAAQEAATQGNWETFRILVAHGADLTKRSAGGETTLMAAACFPAAGSVSICRYLIEHGADVNARDYEGKTPLLYLADWSRENSDCPSCERAVATLLLQHGTDVNAKDRISMTAMHYADENRVAAIKGVLQAAGGHY